MRILNKKGSRGGFMMEEREGINEQNTHIPHTESRIGLKLQLSATQSAIKNNFLMMYFFWHSFLLWLYSLIPFTTEFFRSKECI